MEYDYSWRLPRTFRPLSRAGAGQPKSKRL
jgi:hypothetical protein